MNLTDKLIAYESGELTDLETLSLFGELIRSGLVWTLQGHYGRTATDLIRCGYLTKKGEITSKIYEDMERRGLVA